MPCWGGCRSTTPSAGASSSPSLINRAGRESRDASRALFTHLNDRQTRESLFRDIRQTPFPGFLPYFFELRSKTSLGLVSQSS